MMNWKIVSAIGLTSLFALTRLVWSAQYEIDKDHSNVGFTIRHLMISKVRGKFDTFKGTFSYDPDKPNSWKVSATIDPASINTSNDRRDKHLRSADFFDVKKYPTLSFVSTGIKDVTKTSAKLLGNLTLHGVTKPVVLDLVFGGTTTDPWGNKKIAFSATTKINRKDFGLNWNKALETGGVVVGDEVDIDIEIEGNEVEAKK